ncbi:MAG: carboxypeptidase-like regulatory domain-containing protein, partial [Bacteroidota bacterium]
MKYILSAFLVFFSISLFGQERTISGKVTDESGEELIGVTILVEGTNQGVTSDVDGSYSIKADGAASLIFSYVGFETQTININGRAIIDVMLASSVEALEEVVVIGYGVQKKKVVTGSIESVSSKEINAVSVVRVDQALQGRAAGVQVLNQSGQPGERPSIRIRGVGTDGDADPLFLVDGIPVLNIDNLNPADIKSM